LIAAKKSRTVQSQRLRRTGLYKVVTGGLANLANLAAGKTYGELSYVE
jgi:hypothetical protein